MNKQERKEMQEYINREITPLYTPTDRANHLRMLIMEAEQKGHRSGVVVGILIGIIGSIVGNIVVTILMN